MLNKSIKRKYVLSIRCITLQNALCLTFVTMFAFIFVWKVMGKAKLYFRLFELIKYVPNLADF